jgi:hypothetical protein
MTYIDLRPDEVKHVRVLLEDGRRVEGWLEAWREDRDGWRGWVRYSTGLAETRVAWFAEDRLTPV